MPTAPQRLITFVSKFEAMLSRGPEEAEILREGGNMLRRLVATDDWLSAEFAAPSATQYRQYILHCDPEERFCVVSFVWGPGQSTPIHNHTVWGIVGVLRGAEIAEPFEVDQGGPPRPMGAPIRLEAGQVVAVSPSIGDVHRVSNAYDDRPSISIHVYGTDIGRVRRTSYDADGRPKPFVSGYSNRDQ